MNFISFLLKQSFSGLDGVEFSADEKTLLLAPEDLFFYTVPAKCEIISGGNSQLQSSFFQCINNIKKIDFEKGSKLRCIFPYVFKGSSLQEINMTYCTNLKFLNYSVFYGCNSLITAILPEGMTELKPGSFAESKSLQSIKLPDSIEKLPGWDMDNESVFTGCSLLKEVIITPTSNLKVIAPDVFLHTSLAYIYIPSQAYDVGTAFFGSKVENIEVSRDNQHYIFDGNSLLSKNGETLYYFKYNNGVSYTIPSSVKYIHTCAFRDNNITEVKFTSNILSYMNFAFAFTKITYFKLPPGSTSLAYKFLCGCKFLETVELTDEIITINEGAFKECPKLRSIKLSNNIQTIQTMAFFGDVSLVTFDCPTSLTFLGPGALSSCDNLIFNENGNTKFTISEDVLYCDKKAALAYFGTGSNVKLLSTCTEVSDYAFSSKPITKVILQSPTTFTIKEHAFSHTKLVDVALPSCITELGDSAFSSIDTLNSVTIPADAQLKIIGPNCFYNSSLQSITLPTGLETVMECSFMDCTQLTQIDLFNTKVKTLGNKAFKSCSITEANLPATFSSIGEECFSDSKLATLILNPCTLVTISAKAFYNCADLSSVTLCDSVTKIKRQSFAFCISIVELTFPKQIEFIEARAFDECINFQKFNLKANCNLNTIEGRAFNGCNKLREIGLEKGETKFYTKDGVLTDKKVTKLIIFLPAAKTTIYVVPATIEEIGNYAFYSCTNLRTIVIPEGSIQSVGYSSFEGCTSLTSLYLPPSLKLFGNRAFKDCTALRCGSVMYFNPDKARAMEVGIPKIAFETDCPTVSCQTCKVERQHFFGLHLFSIVLMSMC